MNNSKQLHLQAVFYTFFLRDQGYFATLKDCMARSSKRQRPLPSRDFTLFYKRIFPLLRALIKIGYFSFEVEGLKNVPRNGRIVYVGNHAGWFTLDSFFFALAVCEGLGNEFFPHTAVHDMLIKTPGFKSIFKDLSVIPASWLHNMDEIPSKIKAFGFYPEGAEGNCKPFWKAYRMRKWKTGFVRIAITRKAKVIPVAIIGSEECLPVAGGIRLLERFIGSVMPMPLVGIPLPSKWKMIFHKPIDFSSYPVGAASDRALCMKLAAKVQKVVQKTLDKESADRPIAKVAALADKFSNFSIHKALAF